MTSPEPGLLLSLDLVGTFAFALNGALTAVRVARLDIVGVLTLGLITAMGGGILRDILMGHLPPTTFNDWRYLAVAAAGGLVAFVFSERLIRINRSITVLDAAGLSLFAVTGATLALDNQMGPAQAVILGVLTGVGGGTLRDIAVQRLPVVLGGELYAIPATVAALVTVVADQAGWYAAPAAVAGAAACFAIRMVGVRFDLQAPRPRGTGDR